MNSCMCVCCGCVCLVMCVVRAGMHASHMCADLYMRGHACFVFVMYVKYGQVLWVCVPVCMCVRGWVIYSALCVCKRARAASVWASVCFCA